MGENIRPAELAGAWYPAAADACDAFLDPVSVPGHLEVSQPVAAIVPHAGWVYSGSVAFEALLALKERKTELVVLFGGHLGPRDRVRILIDGAWETPYGPMPVAAGLAEDMSMALESEIETAEEYYDDNAVEVLVPMAKKLFPSAKLLTIGVPPTPDASRTGKEAIRLAKARGYENITVIGSTDLTHYGPNYSFRPHGSGLAALDWVKTKNDPELIEKILALDPGKVIWTAQRGRNACCPGAVAATLTAAKHLGANKAQVTRYTTSWDVRPSEDVPSSFVGYVGVVLGSAA